MKAKLKSTPSGIRNKDIDFNSRIYKDDFKNNLDYEEIWINESVESTPVQIVYNGKNPAIKKILMYPGIELYAGDFVNRQDGSVWLTQVMDKNVIYKSGTIEKSNQQLKWIDDMGNIQSYPAVLYYNARSNFGTEEGKVITLPDGRRQIVTQKNPDTLKLHRGLRFIFGNEVFTTIDYDFVSDEGLVNLSLQSDQYNPATDSMELGIADYTRISSPEIILLDPSAMILKIGMIEQIDLRVANKYGVIDTPVAYISSNTNVATVSSSGLIEVVGEGEAVITMSIKYGDTKQIEITGISEEQPEPEPIENNRAEIAGQDHIVYGQKATYTIQFFDNNQIVNKPAIFSLTDELGKATKMATISSQNSANRTVTIQAISWSPTGAENVKLIATSTDGKHSISKIISIGNYRG